MRELPEYFKSHTYVFFYRTAEPIKLFFDESLAKYGYKLRNIIRKDKDSFLDYQKEYNKFQKIFEIVEKYPRKYAIQFENGKHNYFLNEDLKPILQEFLKISKTAYVNHRHKPEKLIAFAKNVLKNLP